MGRAGRCSSRARSPLWPCSSANTASARRRRSRTSPPSTSRSRRRTCRFPPRCRRSPRSSSRPRSPARTSTGLRPRRPVDQAGHDAQEWNTGNIAVIPFPVDSTRLRPVQGRLLPPVRRPDGGRAAAEGGFRHQGTDFFIGIKKFGTAARPAGSSTTGSPGSTGPRRHAIRGAGSESTRRPGLRGQTPADSAWRSSESSSSGSRPRSSCSRSRTARPRRSSNVDRPRCDGGRSTGAARGDARSCGSR